MSAYENKTWYVCDGENTGPDTQWHSLHWFGVVKLTEALDVTFEGKMRPRNLRDEADERAGLGPAGYHPESMKHNGGVSWEVLKTWPEPSPIITQFTDWVIATLEPGTTPLFLSDNTGHDKKWLDIYVDQYGPVHTKNETWLGHSSQSLKDRFQGFKQGYKAASGKEVPEEFRSLERMAITKHNHTPLDDARGRAEALLKLREIGFPVVVY